MKNISTTLLLLISLSVFSQSGIKKYDIEQSIYRIKDDKGKWKYESMDANKLFKFVVDQNEKKIYVNWMMFDIFTIVESHEAYKKDERYIYEYLCTDIEGNNCVIVLEKYGEDVIEANIDYDNFQVIFSLKDSQL